MKISYIILSILLGLIPNAKAKDLIQVQSLSKKMIQQNAQWVAKENSFSNLTHNEIKNFLGLSQEIYSDVEFVSPKLNSLTVLPRSLDWRNKDGKNWVSPILNQGNCGSCVAFAAVGVLETQYKISTSFFNFNIKLSPQSLFACGGGKCSWGWMPSSAANYIQKRNS